MHFFFASPAYLYIYIDTYLPRKCNPHSLVYTYIIRFACKIYFVKYRQVAKCAEKNKKENAKINEEKHQHARCAPLSKRSAIYNPIRVCIYFFTFFRQTLFAYKSVHSKIQTQHKKFLNWFSCGLHVCADIHVHKVPQIMFSKN